MNSIKETSLINQQKNAAEIYTKYDINNGTKIYQNQKNQSKGQVIFVQNDVIGPWDTEQQNSKKNEELTLPNFKEVLRDEVYENNAKKHEKFQKKQQTEQQQNQNNSDKLKQGFGAQSMFNKVKLQALPIRQNIARRKSKLFSLKDVQQIAALHHELQKTEEEDNDNSDSSKSSNVSQNSIFRKLTEENCSENLKTQESESKVQKIKIQSQQDKQQSDLFQNFMKHSPKIIQNPDKKQQQKQNISNQNNSQVLSKYEEIKQQIMPPQITQKQQNNNNIINKDYSIVAEHVNSISVTRRNITIKKPQPFYLQILKPDNPMADINFLKQLIVDTSISQSQTKQKKLKVQKQFVDELPQSQKFQYYTDKKQDDFLIQNLSFQKMKNLFEVNNFSDQNKSKINNASSINDSINYQQNKNRISSQGDYRSLINKIHKLKQIQKIGQQKQDFTNKKNQSQSQNFISGQSQSFIDPTFSANPVASLKQNQRKLRNYKNNSHEAIQFIQNQNQTLQNNEIQNQSQIQQQQYTLPSILTTEKKYNKINPYHQLSQSLIYGNNKFQKYIFDVKKQQKEIELQQQINFSKNNIINQKQNQYNNSDIINLNNKLKNNQALTTLNNNQDIKNQKINF